MYSGVVSLRLHLPCFNLCWSFGVAGLGWYPCSRLKHNWSVHVECRGWGLITSDIKLVSYSSTITMKQGPIYIIFICI